MMKKYILLAAPLVLSVSAFSYAGTQQDSQFLASQAVIHMMTGPVKENSSINHDIAAIKKLNLPMLKSVKCSPALDFQLGMPLIYPDLSKIYNDDALATATCKKTVQYLQVGSNFKDTINKYVKQGESFQEMFKLYSDFHAKHKQK